MRPTAIHEILLATDFSPSSAAATDAAAALAERLHARLHILHVAHPREATQALVALSRLRAPTGIESVKALETGPAQREILRYARTSEVDLIVMGSRGRPGHGSVAEAVVRGAPCQVLTIRYDSAGQANLALSKIEDGQPRAVGHCLVCAQESGGSICEPCARRITAEAWARKLRELHTHV